MRLARHRPLRPDHLRQVRARHAVRLLDEEAIRGADHQDRRARRGIPQTFENLPERDRVGRSVPARRDRFVGAVGDDDERRIAPRDVRGQQVVRPAEHHRGLSAVDAQCFVGDAGRVVGGPSEQAHGAAGQGANGEAVRPGSGLVFEMPGPQVAAGGHCPNRLSIHGEFEIAAAGLFEIEERQVLAFRREGDGFARAPGGDADAAESLHAVARVRRGAAGPPAGGLRTARVEAAIAEVGAARQRESRAAFAESGLQLLPQRVGKIVGGAMRVAVVQDVDRSGAQLLEERGQRGGILQSARSSVQAPFELRRGDRGPAAPRGATCQNQAGQDHQSPANQRAHRRPRACARFIRSRCAWNRR